MQFHTPLECSVVLRLLSLCLSKRVGQGKCRNYILIFIFFKSYQFKHSNWESLWHWRMCACHSEHKTK